MILGRGTAQTAAAIMAEYRQFLQTSDSQLTPVILKRLQEVPEVMQQRLGKPVTQWKDEDLLRLYSDREKTTRYGYSAFWAFLLFRGYRQATIELLPQLPFQLTRHHRDALTPVRRRLEQTQTTLHYAQDNVGTILRLLVALLAVVGKPLEDITRPDFERFRDEYQHWYRETARQANRHPDPRLTRLEYYLVAWSVIPPAKIVFRHQEHFAQLSQPFIRQAILLHMQWCDAKYQPSTIHSRRAALLNFFLW